MRLRSPAEYYLKYLLLHPENHSTPEVILQMEELGLDAINTPYVERLRTKLKPPKPFYPLDKGHAASFRYLLREKINRVFVPDKNTRVALEIVRKPRAKELVEALLLSQTPHDYVCAVLGRTRKIVCTPEALKVYEHYFWNLDLIDSSQMRVLLQLRYKTLNGSDDGVVRMLDRAYYQDPRRVASELPSSPTTAMLTQLRMGVLPGKTDIGTQALDNRRIAMLRASEALYRDGPNDSQRGMNHLQSVRMLTDLLEFVVKPDQNMQEQLAAVTLRTDTRSLPTLAQLSGGRHTAEMQPLKDRHDDVIETVGERSAGDHGD